MSDVHRLKGREPETTGCIYTTPFSYRRAGGSKQVIT